MVMNTIKNQQGLAAVEFAIVLPVMLFLMLATAEFGRVFYHYNTLTKAVQTGARYASRPLLGTNDLTNMDADFVQSIQNFVVYGNENGGGTAVLDGFTLTGATSSAMLLTESSPTVRNCTFKNNGGSGSAINAKPPASSHMYVSNSTFTGNTGSAMRNNGYNGKRVYITNCTFKGNSGANGGAIYRIGFINCCAEHNPRQQVKA